MLHLHIYALHANITAVKNKGRLLVTVCVFWGIARNRFNILFLWPRKQTFPESSKGCKEQYGFPGDRSSAGEAVIQFYGSSFFLLFDFRARGAPSRRHLACYFFNNWFWSRLSTGTYSIIGDWQRVSYIMFSSPKCNMREDSRKNTDMISVFIATNYSTQLSSHVNLSKSLQGKTSNFWEDNEVPRIFIAGNIHGQNTQTGVYLLWLMTTGRPAEGRNIATGRSSCDYSIPQ